MFEEESGQPGGSSVAVKKRRNRKSQLVIFIVAGAALISMLGGMGALFYARHHRPSLPADKIARLTFPVYFPAQVPEGLTYDPLDTSVTDSSLLYTFAYDNGKKIVVTVQALPQDFSSASFNPDKDFTTNIGHAYLVDLDDRTTAAVITDKALILLNAPQKVAQSTLTELIDSLRPVRR